MGIPNKDDRVLG